MTAPPDLPFSTRIWFAWACLLRVLFDGAFAARAFAVREKMPAALPAPREEERPPASMEPPPPKAPRVDRKRLAETVREARPDLASATAARETGGLLLLALLQREGRLIDFLRQDVSTFSDEDVGAAARVVHAGCRKALEGHATLEVVRSEDEGASVEVPEGFEPSSIKLTGDVRGAAPFRGKLRHRGWRAKELRLPEPSGGHDVRILAPAEVEL